jgi:uncharacterized protein (TIGR02678 family)
MSVREQTDQAELREAARWLLEQPLVFSSQDPERFAFVRRHQEPLKAWFQQWMNYRLVVDRDFARLHKIALPVADSTRPARRRSGAPFDRQRYVLLTLILTVLESGSQQVALSSLARSVQEIAQLEQLPSPTFERRGERQAFVDVVRFLVSCGVLRFVDGDDEGYLRGLNDALYDVEQRIAANLLCTGWLPGASPDDALGDTGVYAENQEGGNLRLRHRLMRMLCENPVLYYEDLRPDEKDYVIPTRPTFRQQLQSVFGLRLEARSDGLLPLDEQEGLTDLAFPAQSSVAHAALLLAFELALAAGDEGEDHNRVFTEDEVLLMLSALVRTYGRYWKSEYTGGNESRWLLLDEVAPLLEAFGFVRRQNGALQVRPLINRYLADPNKYIHEEPMQ